MKFILILMTFIYYAVAEEVRLVDLDPNEAQQLINSQDQTLKYAPKIESNVPAVRYLGNEPHHVQEDIYLAKQYHGQDGLGGYLYGYQVPDISKNEKKEAGGDLRGAYNYINGDGKEVKVQYWDDGTGFHQVDNVPEIAPKQVEDSPDVAAVKQEFFRRWHEEAERNQHPVTDPNVKQYSANQQGLQQSQYQHQPAGGAQYFSNPNPQYNAQYSGAASSPNQRTVPYQQGQQPNLCHHCQSVGQPLNQGLKSQTTLYQAGSSISSHSEPGVAPQASGYLQGNQAQPSYTSQTPGKPIGSGFHQSSQQSQPNPLQNNGWTKPSVASGQNQIDYSGQYSNNKNYYEQPQHGGKTGEDEENNGPPKGFFYSFDYPVGIIVQKGARALPAQGGEPRNVRDVYEQNKANFEAQLQAGKGSGTQSSYLFVKN